MKRFNLKQFLIIAEERRYPKSFIDMLYSRGVITWEGLTKEEIKRIYKYPVIDEWFVEEAMEQEAYVFSLDTFIAWCYEQNYTEDVISYYESTHEQFDGQSVTDWQGFNGTVWGYIGYKRVYPEWCEKAAIDLKSPPLLPAPVPGDTKIGRCVIKDICWRLVK